MRDQPKCKSCKFLLTLSQEIALIVVNGNRSWTYFPHPLTYGSLCFLLSTFGFSSKGTLRTFCILMLQFLSQLCFEVLSIILLLFSYVKEILTTIKLICVLSTMTPILEITKKSTRKTPSEREDSLIPTNVIIFDTKIGPVKSKQVSIVPRSCEIHIVDLKTR